MGQQVGDLLFAVERAEAAHRRGTGEGHDIDAVLQELTVDVELRVVLGRQCAECRGLAHIGAGRYQRIAQRVAATGGRRHQDPALAHRVAAAHRGDDRLHAETFSGQIDANAEPRELRARADTGRADPGAGQGPRIAAAVDEPVHEAVHAVDGREHDPVGLRCGIQGEVERLEVVELGHSQHRRLDRLGTGGFQQFDQFRGLVA
jgi:hypothetical protein